MGFVRRVISGALDLANLAKHNANFADIETDLTEHRGRIAGAETKLTAQSDRIDNLVISGDSGPEAADARVSVLGETYSTLKHRLDNEISGVTAQLAETEDSVTSLSESTSGQLALKASKAELLAGLAPKADQAYVDTQFANIVSGSPKGTYTTLAALIAALPTGAEGTFLVLENGEWYYWNDTAWTSGGVYQSTKLADESVKYTNLSFDPVVGQLGKNLFNRHRISHGYYASNTTGLIVPSPDFSVSEFIRIDPSTAYYWNQGGIGAYYDAAKAFISGYPNGTYKLNTPVNAVYVRVSSLTAYINEAQLELGTAETEYEDGSPKITASQIRDAAEISAGINKIFPWRTASLVDGTTINVGETPVFQSYKTGQFVYFNIAGPSPNYTIPDGYHLALEWDETATTTYTTDFSKLTLLAVSVNLTSIHHVIASNIAGNLTSPIPEIQQAIYKFNNPVPIINQNITPLRIMLTLKEATPLYYQKLKAQAADLTTILIGDSISTTNNYTTSRTDVKYRPPLMTEHAYVTYIEEWLRWDGQRYYRYDAGLFTETAASAVTKEYDLAWDWVGTTEENLYAINNRPALTRILDGTNASVSYTVPDGVKRCDFIYRTDYLNAASATVTISSGNGVLQVYSDVTSAWVEANGFTYSAKEADALLPGNLRKSMYQKRMKMRVVGTLGTTTVTITNSGIGRLTYWGIQTGIREFMHDFILAARGGHSITRLENFEAWDIDYYRPDVILWELPIINQGLDVANSSFVPNTMTKTTDDFAAEILTKANQFIAKAYAPELVSWVMFFAYGNNAINDDNEWVYGNTVSGEKVTTANYVSKTVSQFAANDLVLLDLFSLYMDYSRKRSEAAGASIRSTVLQGSGMMGDSLTIDGAHLNDNGARVSADMFGSFFVQ